MSFNHLNIPDHWQQTYSKYPEGYTLLEALLNWVSQVNALTDNVNTWNTYLEDFVKTFDTDLQQEVSDTLSKWQADGTLEVVISEALQTGIDSATARIDKIEPFSKNIVHLSNIAGIDMTGITSSSDGFQTALNTGGIIQLPESCTILLDRNFILDGKEIHGAGRNSIIKLGADVNLFNIISSNVVIKGVRFLVPATNTKQVIKVTPPTGKVIKYTELDIWIEGLATGGSWTGIQLDMSSGFLFYRNKIKASITYPYTGLEVIGTGGVTGNLFDLEIDGFKNGIDLNGTDSVQNNRFVGELQHERAEDTNGAWIRNGWGNRFDFNCWDDSASGQYTAYRFEAPTYNNHVNGHIEGRFVDLGANLFHTTLYKWGNPKTGVGDFRDVYDNQQPAPVNVLVNDNFSIGNNAGWTNGFSDRTTLARDSATFGYTVMKLSSISSTIGWAFQQIPDFAFLKGKTVYLGAWVYISAASGVDRVSGISIQDGVNVSYSELVPRDSQWHWVTVKHKVSADATVLQAELGRVDSALGKAAASGDIVFFANPVMVVGGKLRPHQGNPSKRLLKYTPTNNTDAGKAGDMCYDDSYVYIWTSDNTVRRAALGTW
jgi:hypothetical protein